MKRSILLIFLFSFFFFSCEEEIVEGCMDSTACNYDASATDDDGSCNYPLESILEITYSEDYLTGLINETMTSNIHLRNSSCESVSIQARRLVNQGVVEDFSAYFCFAGFCFDESVLVSPITLLLGSYEVDDYFTSYFTSPSEGVFDVRYRFYLEDDPSIYIDKILTYEITSS